MFGFVSTLFGRNGTRTTTSRFMSGFTLFEQRAVTSAPGVLRRNTSSETNLYLQLETPPSRTTASPLLISASSSRESFFIDEASDSITDGITDELKCYLESFPEAEEESYVALFDELGISDTEEAESFLCPVTLDVTNKPVKVNGITLDYDSLLRLSVNADGTRTNPMTRDSFYLVQVEPDYDRSEAMFDYIEACKASLTVVS